MPYDVRKRGGKYCVVKKDTNETVACHKTPSEAQAHKRALYANVKDAKK